MKDKNWGRRERWAQGETQETDLKNGVLLLRLELVGTEELETALGLGGRKTLLGTLEQLEDVVDDNGLKVDLFFVVKVVGLEFDLLGAGVSASGRLERNELLA